ncbi:prepilin-type N-terminal cleavage/methylation domain-containing protein [Pseudoalteromonas piscicida]|uniref:prepilin-type N-terminal cleavage/methylation domain-containing protein n=1 Tax=Pseudoalteromonas piscicida TaxID=43662 RepID=UPI0027E3B6CF|nr:prepilin-type N-terminal cleavage/methylation domain-containing protein [Pseudoalteromonas piscicida]WMO14811.1 prepilin-type N-terminal cleavage/methylation domain-containing protein [Pseudoalteromonas piscicida]
MFTSRGFTMVELLVVLVLIGLLSSFVGPMVISQVEKTEAKIEAAQILKLFENASQTAFWLNERVLFRTEANNILVVREVSGKQIVKKEFRVLRFKTGEIEIGATGDSNARSLNYYVNDQIRTIELVSMWPEYKGVPVNAFN